MKVCNNGGPAFPALHNLASGMTLRDYFAAKAMQGLIASNANACTTDQTAPALRALVSTAAYAVADAMLKARTA